MTARFHERLLHLIVATGVVVATLLAAIGCGDVQPEDRQRKRGIVLISIDTLRADHLGCYGSRRPTSPFIDRLAATGLRFEHAIVQVPGTLPSHMSMLTGLLPAEHGVFPPDGVLSPEIATVAEVLQRAGVRTAGFTEGGYVSGRYGFSRGFDEFDDARNGLNSDVEDTLRRGLAFLGSVSPDEEFFLFLHTYAVHDPYFPPPPYSFYYLGGEASNRTSAFEPIPVDYNLLKESSSRLEERQAKHYAAAETVAAVLPPGSPMPTGPQLSGFNRGRVAIPSDAVPVYEALYDATVNYVDDLLQAFFRHLTDLGLDSTTTVIITSDHGEEFLEHGRLVHEQVYHECLHVPLIVVGPGIEPGTVRNPVMSVDLTPTILDLFGLPAPIPVSGRSLVPHNLDSAHRAGEPRDAHAKAVVDPVESLYRLIDGRLLQLVMHSPQLLEADPWVEHEIELHPVSSKVQFNAMSYDRPRTVRVEIDGRPWGELACTPAWQPFEIELPDDGARHVVTMTADGCVSPASLGRSTDTRCLAFRLGGFESRRTELFDLTTDPRGSIDLSARRPDLTALLLDGLEFFHRQPVAAARTVPLDKAVEEQLRALGYLE